MNMTTEINAIAGLVEQAWQLLRQSGDEGESNEAREQWQTDKQQLLASLGQSEPLAKLRQRFGLERWQLAILLLAALPAIDPRYRSLYSELNPRNQPDPSLDWLLALLADDDSQKQRYLQALAPDSPLLRYRLVIPPDSASRWLDGPLLIAPDLLSYLLEQPLSADPNRCLSLLASPQHSLLPPAVVPTEPLVQLVGEQGSGRRSVALWCSGQAGRPLLQLDNTRLWQFSEPEQVLADCLRFATLAHAELLWPQGLSALAEQPGSQPLLLDWLSDCDSARLWCIETDSQPWPHSWRALQPRSLTVEQGSRPRQVQLWQTMAAPLLAECRDSQTASDELDCALLAERYTLAPGEINQVLMQLGCQCEGLNTDAALQACLARTPLSLSGLAQRIDARIRLSDLVLPLDTASHLDELVQRHRMRQLLQQRGICTGTGLMALFSGSPGTGKTMASEAIAEQLQLPLYKVNLANIASKWIGETEKHLAQLFDDVEQNNGILFFDEADAIFGRRSQVESSNDKNANMGVSYLLQRVESFSGLLILATNFKANLDRAFLRRLQFSIEFIRPDQQARQELWQRWADKIPLAPQLTPVQLAEQLEMTGAQIRNIAQQAMALALAANEQQPLITPALLLQAIRREFQKNDDGFLVQQKLARWLQTDSEEPHP